MIKNNTGHLELSWNLSYIFVFIVVLVYDNKITNPSRQDGRLITYPVRITSSSALSINQILVGFCPIIAINLSNFKIPILKFDKFIRENKKH